MPRLTDPRAVRSRQSLREALLRLLEHSQFEQITIRDITTEADVGYATYFRHFPTKEALLDDLAAEQIQTLISLSVPVLDAQDLRAASEALFSYVHAHRSLWRTLLTGGAAGTIRDEFLKLAKQAGEPRADGCGRLPTDLGVMLIVSGTIELLSWWLQQTEPKPVAQMAELLDSVVISPVMAAHRNA